MTALVKRCQGHGGDLTGLLSRILDTLSPQPMEKLNEV